MRIDGAGERHLTYCTNVHPAETLADVMRVLEGPVIAVARAMPRATGPFGVGLRVPARAARELATFDELERMRAWLEERNLYVFTLNGFPYGGFHADRVKEDVYRPDWRDERRQGYSDRLAFILAYLLPKGVEGSVSTVPCGYGAHASGHADAAVMASYLVRHVERLVRIREMTGKTVRLGLEPEPFCVLATAVDAVRWFERVLLPVGIPELMRRLGVDRAHAEREIREHVGICLDACHVAVALEDPRAALRTLAGAGIRIVKLQISAGIEVRPTREEWPQMVASLAPLARDRYLHQVTELRAGAASQWEDLPQALTAAERIGPPDLLRVHFHVPVFERRLGVLSTTQDHLETLLEAARYATNHFEVETYTWDVFPALLRGSSQPREIARELVWARDRLEGPR